MQTVNYCFKAWLQTFLSTKLHWVLIYHGEFCTAYREITIVLHLTLIPVKNKGTIQSDRLCQNKEVQFMSQTKPACG